MGFVRYRQGDGPVEGGYLVDNTVFDLSDCKKAEGDMFSRLYEITKTIADRRLSAVEVKEVTFEIPVKPSKIIRLEGCYEHDVTDEGFNRHVEDAGFNEMSTPSLWVAPTSTLTHHNGTVRIPSQAEDVRPGVELGLVVGTKNHEVGPEDAIDTIAGVTVCTDLAVHDDLPGLEGYKMFDSFLPIGPSIVPIESIDPEVLALGVRHNNEPVDVRSTTSLRFSVAEIISYVSNVMTLEPGDLITTGAPIRGAPTLDDGDEICAWIESVGSLRTTIKRGGAA